VPFLAALMQHPRWREGRLSTAFIAEEFPDGFKPLRPGEAEKAAFAAIAVAAELVRRNRLDSLDGRLRPHSGRMKRDWVVKLDGEYLPVALGEWGSSSDPGPFSMSIAGGPTTKITSDWRPGEPVWRGTVNGLRVAVQIRPALNSVRLAWRGMSVLAQAMLPRTAELERLMPVKQAPDTSKLLLCPMPGLVVSLAVAVGQQVKAGETLAIVEAMKMENVLRAERDVTVSRINAKPGDSLAVDAVIMEFA